MPDRGQKRKLKTRVLEPEEISITGEIEYIIGRAMQGKGVVVSLRELVFFSTFDGDAWLLDARDDLALQLAQERQKLPVVVVESPQQFIIQWGGLFTIENDTITLVDNLGREFTLFGDTATEIVAAVRRVRAGQ